ncbi:hypothetical protein SFR_3084 [Streptomyces sp. FR-008]|nr:hypothetical protein SFR_3084 [Streptomyces sp. FR-008]
MRGQAGQQRGGQAELVEGVDRRERGGAGDGRGELAAGSGAGALPAGAAGALRAAAARGAEAVGPAERGRRRPGGRRRSVGRCGCRRDSRGSGSWEPPRCGTPGNPGRAELNAEESPIRTEEHAG